MRLFGCSEMFYKDICLKFAFALSVISVIVIAKSYNCMHCRIDAYCTSHLVVTRCEVLIGAFVRMIFGTSARRWCLLDLRRSGSPTTLTCSEYKSTSGLCNMPKAGLDRTGRATTEHDV